MEPKDRCDVEVTMSAAAAAPACARNVVARWLRGRVLDAVLDDAVLLVSELVTNSARHAVAPSGATISVRGPWTIASYGCTCSIRAGRVRSPLASRGTTAAATAATASSWSPRWRRTGACGATAGPRCGSSCPLQAITRTGAETGFAAALPLAVAAD